MPNHLVWMIFRKELVDLFRDRKTLIGAFLIPIVLIPFVFFLLGSAFNSVEQDARAYVPIAVEGDPQSPPAQLLAQAPGVRILQPEDSRQALLAGELRAIVSIPPDFEQKIKRWQPAKVTIFYDSTNQKSVYGRGVIEDVLDTYAATVTDARLKGAGLDSRAIKPIETSFQNVASDEKLTGGMLAGIIPLMLVLSLASGGIAAATDLVAGEKERGTLESLVSAPIPAGSILTAKLLTVMVMSCMSAAATLISLSLVFRFGPMTGEGEAFSLGFLSPLSVGVLAVTLLLLAAMFAGLELTISTLAKTFKEAQTYMTGVVFLAMVPSYMMMPLNPVDIPALYYLLPIFNGVAMCKEVFYGAVDPIHAAMALGTSLLYVAAAIGFAARLFRKEGAVLKA
ncbi:ABC transporter permease [Brevibacillus sp. H7]|uniref:ABC transporter permease n=1 Tax=Brevibacillus sp. H7 TaxID=3349138 RepID=UPI0038233FA2